MEKISVLFPYVEAGFGHIMPMRAIEETFRKKYGDRVEVISSQFFTETDDQHMIRYEQMISRQVKIYNRFPPIGFMATTACALFGTRLSTFGSMRATSPIAHNRGMEHMKALHPDVVISTHWASNYFAERQPNKPLTIMYCPDARLNHLFEYPCDLLLISMPSGYQKALKKKKYNEDNIKLVPFFIRNEAFDIAKRDKKELRRELGLPEDNFTVVMAEGGYGIGKMEEMSRRLTREHVPMTVIPVCGTNEKLYQKLLTIQSTDEVTFRPYAFTDKILELEAASDIFCGKSGNILAEPTFFGVPSMVTHFANSIERYIADHYINTVGSTIKEFSADKAVKQLKRFAADPSLLEPYREAARRYHEHFGTEEAADLIWQKIVETYPDRVDPDEKSPT